ncbi:MAG: 50S ribosomal protein L25 [Treponema sp.]|jgi:large subunit ribosomal protein L25|nr:50S ribosomal protein L25 [Treponema sp.]
MSQLVLKARSRDKKGSAEARKIRHAGRVPGVLYGRSGESISIDLDAKEFAVGVKHISESTIVKVELEGKSFDAFVKDTQRNIMDGKVLHVDFYEVESGIALRAHVPVHLNGNPIGVREGGLLEFPLHEIEVECLPKDLPERIELDISQLGANQSIHVRDIPLAEGVKLLSGGDQVVCLVKYAKEAAAAAPAAEDAAATSAAAAPAADAEKKEGKA